MLPKSLFANEDEYLAYQRDYFAGQALTGYIAHLGARGIGAGCYIGECAAESYQIAEAMLTERSKATKETGQ